MDIIFLQDTQLSAGSAACTYDAVIRHGVNFLINGSYPWKENRALYCSDPILCSYNIMWRDDAKSRDVPISPYR